MASNKKLLILAGDGIGPEVMTQVKRVISWFEKRRLCDRQARRTADR